MSPTFLTKSLTLGMSFLTTLQGSVEAKLAILNISPLISLILVLSTGFLTS